MAIGIDATNNTTQNPSVFKKPVNVVEEHGHDETHQDQGHSDEKEGNRVDNYFEVAHVIGVGDG